MFTKLLQWLFRPFVKYNAGSNNHDVIHFTDSDKVVHAIDVAKMERIYGDAPAADVAENDTAPANHFLLTDKAKVRAPKPKKAPAKIQASNTKAKPKQVVKAAVKVKTDVKPKAKAKPKTKK